MGSFRSQPDLEKHVHKGKCENLEYCVCHMCGWRMYMEDACISVVPFSKKKFSLFGVFDGHGGPQVSAFVQRHFAKQLQNNDNFMDGNYERALKETFLKMDELLLTQEGKSEVRQIQKQMRKKGNGPDTDQPSYAGCTANVVLITPKFIYCANAGDSRSVASINTKTQALSEDHKPQNEIEGKRIYNAGGQVVSGRVNGNLNLSRALGDLQYKTNKKLSPQEQMITADPEVKKIKNESIDYIIMGCDGIWQVKSNGDMVNWITKRRGQKKGHQDILEQLLGSLVAKDSSGQYGMDNMSSILITFN